jgi:hypothetical protein
VWPARDLEPTTFRDKEYKCLYYHNTLHTYIFYFFVQHPEEIHLTRGNFSEKRNKLLVNLTSVIDKFCGSRRHFMCLFPADNSGKLGKESRNRPGVAHRVPGGLGSQISMTFGT